MQMPPERLLTEESLKHLGSLFAECVKEAYKDSLPNAKFTVYMRTPKYDDKGKESSAIRYEVSDDTVDDETLKEQMELQHEPLGQCLLDKISANKDREPGRNWVGYYGRVLTLGKEQPSIGEVQPSMSNESIEGLSLDESQWIEIIKFAQRRNWYSKYKIIGGVLRQTIIQISLREIWDLLKARLSEGIESGDEHLTDLMEKIKDLPLEDVLEEIRKHLDGFIL